MTETNVSEVLENRGSKYGSFKDNADVTTSLMEVVEKHKNWDGLDSVFKESLRMIFHKVSRIVNGDPFYDDSWIDISGYAQLSTNYIHSLNKDDTTNTIESK